MYVLIKLLFSIKSYINNKFAKKGVERKDLKRDSMSSVKTTERFFFFLADFLKAQYSCISSVSVSKHVCLCPIIPSNAIPPHSLLQYLCSFFPATCCCSEAASPTIIIKVSSLFFLYYCIS